MSFLRRRTASEQLIPQRESAENTYLARLAREEAEDDWRKKPRHEKLRLARAELRRRKSEKDGLLHSAFWTKETILIAGIALLGILGLLYLLHYRSTLDHKETWLESVEEVLGIV